MNKRSLRDIQHSLSLFSRSNAFTPVKIVLTNNAHRIRRWVSIRKCIMLLLRYLINR